MSAHDLLSTRSKAYQARKDEVQSMSESQLVAAMVDEPTLIRRPIVIAGDSHVVGSRKPDLEALVRSAT